MDSIVCLNGQIMRRDSIQNGANARFLVDSTFKFAERINAMQLTDAEVAIFCAVVLVAPDRHGIRNYELINRMHTKLKQCLQHIISKGRPNEPEFMGNLMNTIGDLKTLSTLHTEKLIVFRNELSQQLNHEQQQQVQVTDVTVSSLESHSKKAKKIKRWIFYYLAFIAPAITRTNPTCRYPNNDVVSTLNGATTIRCEHFNYYKHRAISTAHTLSRKAIADPTGETTRLPHGLPETETDPISADPSQL